MNQKKCVTCGSEYPSDAAKCPVCGQPNENAHFKMDLGTSVNEKVQSSEAEDVMDTLAKVIIRMGNFFCGFSVGVGITFLILSFFDDPYGWEKFFLGIGFLVFSITLFVFFRIAWAKIKVVVNISRNLFVIKETLLHNDGNK